MQGSSLIAALVASLVVSSGAQAQFKAKYYPDCYQPLAQARELIPAPPLDVGKAMGTANKAIGLASSLGGLGGFGGLGGGTLRAAQSVNTLNQYSGLIADAAAFSAAMQAQFPDLGLRLGAYGSKLGEDVDLLSQAGEQVAAGQQCYRQAYEALALATTTGALKPRDSKRQYAELDKGVAFAQAILADAEVRVQQNTKSYNEALQAETSAAGINLDGLLSLAGDNAAMQQLLTATPSEVCATDAWFALAKSACGVPSPARDANGALLLAQDAVLEHYQQLGQMSALGAYGRGSGGSGAAAGMLKGLLNAASTERGVEEGVLDGLIQAGAMSARYLVVSQGLAQAQGEQAALAAYIARRPGI